LNDHDEKNSRVLVARAVNKFSKIPMELISHILCFLDRSSFARTKRVCKKWLEASKRVQPEFDLTNLVHDMHSRFGDNWFSKFIIGSLPLHWSEYPMFPIDYVLANRLVSVCPEHSYIMYPGKLHFVDC
jgi:hypothetical protein